MPSCVICEQHHHPCTSLDSGVCIVCDQEVCYTHIAADLRPGDYIICQNCREQVQADEQMINAYVLRSKQKGEKKKREREQRSADIEAIFTYHPPRPGQQERYDQISKATKELALLIANLTPYSREQSLALTHLQEARMFANAAIAIHEVSSSQESSDNKYQAAL